MNLNLPVEDVKAIASFWNARITGKLSGTNHEFYTALINDVSVVLRLTPVHHRSLDAILGEVKFLQYLHDKARVVNVVSSLKNKLAEQVQIDGRQLIASMFETVKGAPLYGEDAYKAELTQQWGAAMGTLHSISKQYNPGHQYYRRLTGTTLLDLAKVLKIEDKHVTELVNVKWAQIQSWHYEQNDWGIIHGDLTTSNMHLFQGQLYMFDFDNCMYAPYLYDIAVVFHITLIGLMDKDDYPELGQNFVRNFIAGYKRKCPAVIDATLLTLLMDFYNIVLFFLLSGRDTHPYRQHVLFGMRDGVLPGVDLRKIIQEP